MWGISWLAEDLLPFQEGLCCGEFTSLVNSHVRWAVNFLLAPLCRTENGNYNLCAHMCSIWLGWAFSWNLCRYIHNPTESYLNLYSHVCKLQLENCSTDFYKIQYQWILQSLVEPLQYSLTTDNSDNNFTWRPTYIYCNFNYAWGELKPAPLLGYGKNKNYLNYPIFFLVRTSLGNDIFTHTDIHSFQQTFTDKLWT